MTSQCGDVVDEPIAALGGLDVFVNDAGTGVTGTSVVIDGGMLQTGPQAGARIRGHEWRAV